ncbi:MAG: S-methyl-5-thioribose-1-phosphate isomerase [Phaeodactylibacter sp.]|nr:S-methyl-5-thioribose-1-phosphate isomerase [Phaeodactylibacter sp.]
MNINGQHYRTIWVKPDDPTTIQIIDQRWLPHELVIEDLRSLDEFVAAIKEMHVRGAPLIGATAAFGMYNAVLNAPEAELDTRIEQALHRLQHTRPTAVDLFYVLERMRHLLEAPGSQSEKTARALAEAKAIADESAEHCRRIGLHGLPLIEAISKAKGGKPVNILTHCNAGWIACIDYGTATAPIYAAHDKGIEVHVWVDETRPRNQGARLTAYELLQHGVPHTVIVDNVGGHLMQHGQVDLVIVGTDRTTVTGDVANKIGTYLKALAAHDNQVPFYVTLPSSSFDWTIRDGIKEIPIETRDSDEVRYIQGKGTSGIEQVLLTPEGSPAINYGFDVTPARLVTALITERGICAASETGILGLYPEKAQV